MHRIRTYHATLAILASLAYATGESGLIHAWLGYGVAVIIVLRLLWALSSERQFGLTRFYPAFEGLNPGNAMTHPFISRGLMLGIALSLILATATGIAMDRGASFGPTSVDMVFTADTDDDEHPDGSGSWSEALEASHELFSDLMLLFVGMHVTYLVLFKLPLARFMLFWPAGSGPRPPQDPGS